MRGLSIRSKMLLMLIASGLACIAAVGLLADRGGRRSMTTSALDQMTQLRAIQQREVEQYFVEKNRIARTLGEMPAMTEGVATLAAAFADLDDATEAEPIATEVKAWYQANIIPELAKLSGGTPQLANYLPGSFAGMRLQRDYIVRNPDKADPRKLDRANSGNYYDLLHGLLHPTIRSLAQRFELEDVMLVEPKNGNIIYTLAKEIDLGTNLKTGSGAQTGAGRAFARAMQNRESGTMVLEDFSPYPADMMRPNSFVGVPLMRHGELSGVMLLQLRSSELNALLTNGGQWEKMGLGKTGEVFLVGSDRLMRSDDRRIIEEPEAFIEAQRKAGVAPATLRLMEAFKSTILLREVDTTAVRAALRGETGTGIFISGDGRETIGSWAPISLAGLRMALVTRQDASEALAPLHRFRRDLLMVASGAVLLLTLASLAAAGVFTAPLRRIMAVADRLASGDDKARIENPGSDEYGAVAQGFNRMADRLTERQAALEGKTRDYEDLLRNVYPEVIAERLRLGETAISESLENVSVIVIAIDGLETLEAHQEKGSALARLNEVVDALDEAALRHGVEKIKTLGETYTAACGLSVMRLDHARRAMAFCTDAARALRRLSNGWQDDLEIRATIVSGEVEAGLVGRHRTVYDIWGSNFLLARRVVFDTLPGHVRVNQAAHDLMPELADFTAMPPISLAGQPPAVTWQRPIAPPANAAEAA